MDSPSVNTRRDQPADLTGADLSDSSSLTRSSALRVRWLCFAARSSFLTRLIGTRADNMDSGTFFITYFPTECESDYTLHR